MAGWYIRRGEKVLGPVPVEKLKEGIASGHLSGKDEVAKDPAGPWTRLEKTSLMRPKPEQPAQLPATVEKPPITPTTLVTQKDAELLPRGQPSPGVLGKSIAAAKAVGGGISKTTGSIANAMSARSQRNHELKLAEIQAKGEAAKTAAATPSVTTVVNVKNINKSGDGCFGCSGCATAIVLAILVLILLAVIGHMQKPAGSRASLNSTPTTPVAAPSQMAHTQPAKAIEDPMRHTAAAKPSQSAASPSSGTVHVQGYYRKDGTYVAPHSRSDPKGH